MGVAWGRHGAIQCCAVTKSWLNRSLARPASATGFFLDGSLCGCFGKVDGSLEANALRGEVAGVVTLVVATQTLNCPYLLPPVVYYLVVVGGLACVPC